MSTNNFQYWWKWTVHCGVGELIGIGVAAVIAVWASQTLGEPHTAGENILAVFIMLFAGLVEGLILGTMQWRVLKIKFPKISYFQWVGLTVLVAMLGWFIGTVSSMAFQVVEEVPIPTKVELLPALWVSFLGPIVMGLVLGTIFGYFQWLVFKQYALYTKRWILANAIGWAAAMLIIFYFASLATPTTPSPAVLLMGIMAGILAGLSVGAITGIALTRIVSLNQKS